MLFVRPSCILMLVFIIGVKAWDSDIEVFDVVEEVGVNFYDLLGVPQDAEPEKIKRAFRKLSLSLHPDKNKAPDAEIKFRQLAAVYDILKDSNKRAKYDHVLEFGLPDWREAVYYYRRVRKMGMVELSIILFIIITIGQYLVAWAAYFEKKYVIEELITARSKKLQKKQKKGKFDSSVIPELSMKVSTSILPKPSVSCTLPVQICKLAWFLVVGLPPLTYRKVRSYYEKKLNEPPVEEEVSEEEVVIPRERGPRRRKAGFTVPEMKEKGSTIDEEDILPPVVTPKSAPAPAMAGGLWTDDDFVDLIRLMKKYPAGTQERWEKIAEVLQRSAAEVAHMAHKMKDEGFKPISKPEEEPQVEIEEPKKTKTRGGKAGVEATEDLTVWSQVQQKAFEAALAKFPKGAASDRWEKIAKCVPGKTKEECMLRFKHLVDLVKKKKEKGPGCEEEPEGEIS